LTLVATTYSICIWRITLRRLLNLSSVLRQKRLALSIWLRFAGQRDFTVHAADIKKHGLAKEGFIDAKIAITRFQ